MTDHQTIRQTDRQDKPIKSPPRRIKTCKTMQNVHAVHFITIIPQKVQFQLFVLSSV